MSVHSQKILSLRCLPVSSACCRGQPIFGDLLGNSDVQQPHLSLMAQIKLARKALVVAQGVAVHHADAYLPEEVSGLLLGLFLQQMKPVLVLETIMRGKIVGGDSQVLFPEDGIIPSVDFATSYLALRFQLNN